MSKLIDGVFKPSTYEEISSAVDSILEDEVQSATQRGSLWRVRSPVQRELLPLRRLEPVGPEWCEQVLDFARAAH